MVRYPVRAVEQRTRKYEKAKRTHTHTHPQMYTARERWVGGVRAEGETEVVSNSEELCRSWDCDCNFFALVVAGSLGYLWYTNQTDYDFIATYDLGGCR